MHIHYTHGQRLSQRRQQVSCVLIRPAAVHRFHIWCYYEERSARPTTAGPSPWEPPPPPGTNEFQSCFISPPSVPSCQPGDIAQHDMAKTLRLHYSRPREHCQILKFMNTAICFYSLVCVCVFHSHSYASASYQGCCASLSWEAAFHLFLKFSEERFCSCLTKLEKLTTPPTNL